MLRGAEHQNVIVAMSDAVIVEAVSKKFCRSLKRSLWYGVQDVVKDIYPYGGNGASNDGSFATDLIKCRRSLRPDEFWAVNNVSFALRHGECIGLIGHNGAGKTTLLKMLNGLIKPDRGRIEIRGRVGALIALGAGFNPILTGRENVYINGTVLGLTKREIDAKFDEIVQFSGLEEFIDMPVQSYSSGMQVRLGFAVATAIEPNILLIDEVLTVGDASFQTKCINVIKSLQKNGVAIILVSHDMYNILRYCHTGLYLRHGQVVATGPIGDVTARYIQDQATTSEEFDVSHPMHSGHVPVVEGFEVGKLSALDSMGRRRDALCTGGGPVILAVPINYKKRYSERVQVELAINDLNGLLYQTISPPLDLPVNGIGGSLEIHIRIEQLPLTATKLTVGVAVWSQGQEMLLGWSRNNQFIFQGETTSPGRLSLPASWRVVAGSETSDSQAFQVRGHCR
jgi:lipopolysaccharide transport system ATP-binding protein